MFRKDASAPRSDRASLYDDITSKIIAELEAGRFPWVQHWGSASVKASKAMPAIYPKPSPPTTMASPGHPNGSATDCLRSPTQPGQRAGISRFRSLSWPTISPISRACSTSARPRPLPERSISTTVCPRKAHGRNRPPKASSPRPEHGGSQVGMSDDVTGTPERLIQFVKRCAVELGLTGRWGFQYANTCSKPRIDGNWCERPTLPG